MSVRSRTRPPRPSAGVERLADSGDRAHGGKAIRAGPWMTRVGRAGRRVGATGLTAGRTAYGGRMPLPPVGDLLAALHVVAIPMRVPFRGVTTREVALLEGPAGWGRVRAVRRVRAARGVALAGGGGGVGVGAAGPRPCATSVPVNATVPAVGAERRGRGAGAVPRVHDGQGQGGRARPGRSPTTSTGSPPSGRSWARRRGCGSTPTAAGRSTTRSPRWRGPGAATASSTPSSRAPPSRSCATCGSPWRATASTCRSRPTSPSARRRTPCACVTSRPPTSSWSRSRRSAGCGRRWRVVEACGLPAVVSSALDTSVGIAAGVALAAALPGLDHACGLGTVALLDGDVAPRSAACRSHGVAGRVGRVAADAGAPRAAAPRRRDRVAWWRERVAACARAT